MQSQATAPISSSEIWLGRQPIVDANKRLVAYEVLYRSADSQTADFSDGNQATSEVLMNTFVEMGFDRVVDDKLAFMNFTRDFLTGEYPLPECPNRLVLEVLEDIQPDRDVVQGLLRHHQAGYQIALDDVVYHPRLEPFLQLASIVKVELPLIPQSEWAGHVKHFRKWPVKLLAEKIETQEEFEYCQELGFDFYQGYFLSKPEIIPGRKLNSNQVVLMKLLAEINSPTADIQSLAKTVESDPGLCLKLLKYVNSSHFGMRRNVESLRHACVVLGIDSLRTITTLLMLAGNRDLPQVAAKSALLRGWMCRRVAEQLELQNISGFFTTGLLSMLDVLLGQPLEKLLDELPIEEGILAAVLSGDGKLGEILHTVISYENCDWHRLQDFAIPAELLKTSYWQAAAEVKSIWDLT